MNKPMPLWVAAALIGGAFVVLIGSFILPMEYIIAPFAALFAFGRWAWRRWPLPSVED